MTAVRYPFMPERSFQPGFRLSVSDIVILIAGGFSSAYLMTVDPWLGIAIAFVVSHFFLFCNVLRMPRPLELIWAAMFAALAVAAIVWRLVPWPLVFVLSAIVTVVVAVVEMRRPSYHGLGWQKLNPGLLTWWQSATLGVERSRPAAPDRGRIRR